MSEDNRSPGGDLNSGLSVDEDSLILQNDLVIHKSSLGAPKLIILLSDAMFEVFVLYRFYWGFESCGLSRHVECWSTCYCMTKDSNLQNSCLLWQHNVRVRPVAMLKFVTWQQGVVCTRCRAYAGTAGRSRYGSGPFAIRMWVVGATPLPLYLLLLLQEGPGTYGAGDWLCLRADLDGHGKVAPTGIRSPYRPARSEALYRLRCLCFAAYCTHSLQFQLADLRNPMFVLHYWLILKLILQRSVLKDVEA
jgi:hypothetical protein